MANEMEEKLNTYGDINLKLIRVADSNSKNALFGSILVTIRRHTEGNKEIIQVKVTPLSASAASVAASSATEKLSINKFEATVNHSDRTIAFGPSHGVQIEEALQNKGIGTFAMNELIEILKKTAKTYTVIPFEIMVSEDFTLAQKERVVAFMGKFNINFSFTDADQRAGYMTSPPPQQLISYYNQSKVQEMDVEKFFFQIIADRVKNESEISHLKHEVDRIGDESFAGIPKKQLVKYTLVCCGLALIFILLLII